MLSINTCLVKTLRFNLFIKICSELKFGRQYLGLIISFISFLVWQFLIYKGTRKITEIQYIYKKKNPAT